MSKKFDKTKELIISLSKSSYEDGYDTASNYSRPSAIKDHSALSEEGLALLAEAQKLFTENQKLKDELKRQRKLIARLVRRRFGKKEGEKT